MSHFFFFRCSTIALLGREKVPYLFIYIVYFTDCSLILFWMSNFSLPSLLYIKFKIILVLNWSFIAVILLTLAS